MAQFAWFIIRLLSEFHLQFLPVLDTLLFLLLCVHKEKQQAQNTFQQSMIIICPTWYNDTPEQKNKYKHHSNNIQFIKYSPDVAMAKFVRIRRILWRGCRFSASTSNHFCSSTLCCSAFSSSISCRRSLSCWAWIDGAAGYKFELRILLFHYGRSSIAAVSGTPMSAPPSHHPACWRTHSG